MQPSEGREDGFHTVCKGNNDNQSRETGTVILDHYSFTVRLEFLVAFPLDVSFPGSSGHCVNTAAPNIGALVNARGRKACLLLL